MQSNIREKPFFKPISSKENTFELTQSKNSQRQGLHHEGSDFLQGRSLQQESTNGEKFSSLHAKLYSETDKIRKWRNQAEYDLKQKDKKIIEASRTIESQRKSLLDIQLQNENLSLKLHEEISSREEILQRVQATRDLVTLLKDHSSRNEEKLAMCRTKETELRYLEKEHVNTFEEMTSKFEKLTCEMKDNNARLTNEMLQLKDTNSTNEEQFKKALGSSEAELKCLLEMCDDKDIEIRDIRSEIQTNNEKIHTQCIHIDKLTEQLKSTKESFTNAERQLEELQLKYEEAKKEQRCVEEKLEEKQLELESSLSLSSQLKKELQETKQIHDEEILSLKKILEETNQELKKTKNRIQFMENDLSRANTLIEETKSSKDMLLLEKTELGEKLKEMEKQNEILHLQKEEHCVTLKELSNNLNSYQEKLSFGQQEMDTLQLQLSHLIQKLAETEELKGMSEQHVQSLEREKQELLVLVSSLQRESEQKHVQLQRLTVELEEVKNAIKVESNEHEHTKSELKKMTQTLTLTEKTLTSTTKDVAKKAKELEKLTEKCASLQTELQEIVTCQEQLRQEMAIMETKLQEEEEEKETLLQEKENNDQSLHGKIESTTKVISELETKNRTMKTDLTSKNKQIKELEKELKGFKSKMTANGKTLDKKQAELAEMEKELEDNVEEKETLENKLKEYEDCVSAEKEETKHAQQEAMDMKNLADSCVLEKEQMIKQCEKQRSEMSAIIDNYKSESDKIVEQKNKEIEQLVERLASAKTAQNTGKICELQKEIETLRKRVSESGAVMENLQKSYGMKETQLQELEKENSKKEEVLKDLQEQLERLYIKKTTSITVQTSPAADKYGGGSKNAHKREPAVQTPRSAVPHTPKAQMYSFDETKKTPNSLKTPQRSILKGLSTYSASKKRKVVFAAKNEAKHISSDDEDSSSYEIMDLEDGIERRGKGLSTPIILKPSPKVRTPEIVHKITNSGDFKRTSPISLQRCPRGPPVDLKSKKEKKKKHSKVDTVEKMEVTYEKHQTEKESFENKAAVRKTPNRSGGKFFKNGLPDRSAKPKEKGETWFELDDVFGFGSED